MPMCLMNLLDRKCFHQMALASPCEINKRHCKWMAFTLNEINLPCEWGIDFSCCEHTTYVFTHPAFVTNVWSHFLFCRDITKLASNVCQRKRAITLIFTMIWAVVHVLSIVIETGRIIVPKITLIICTAFYMVNNALPILNTTNFHVWNGWSWEFSIEGPCLFSFFFFH